MHRIPGVFVICTILLVLGTVYFRFWWTRGLWLAAIAATYMLGYWGLAVQVVMLIGIAFKEIVFRSNAGADAKLLFSESADKIMVTDEASGEITVYDSVDAMPLYVHAKYLKHAKKSD